MTAATGPRRFVFPAAGAAAAAVPGLEPAVLAGHLAAALERHCGVLVVVTPLDEPVGDCAWWTDAAGAVVGVGGGGTIAAAILARQCGGIFEAAAVAVTPQVEHCRQALIHDIRDALLYKPAEWTVAASGPVAAARYAVEAGGVADCVDLAVVPPASPLPTAGADWQDRLDAVIGTLKLPVRLVLHEGPIAVDAARALVIGDVLPIAAAHEVGLRVGGLAWARGNIEDESGSPRIRIVARAARPLLQEPA